MSTRVDPRWEGMGVTSETVEAARELNRLLCVNSRIHDTVVYGMGIAQAHAKGKSLEEWVRIWAAAE